MSELEQLIQQRNEIQRKIAEIKKQGINKVGIVKIDKKCLLSGDLWCIAIDCHGFYIDKEMREKKRLWKSVIIENTRSDAIKAIPQLISDLQNLYDQENMEVES